MSMNHDKDSMFEDMNIKTKLACGILAASLVVLGVLAFTLYMNRNGLTPKTSPVPKNNLSAVSEDTVSGDAVINSSGRTSDELDFWGMYDEEMTEEEETPIKEETRPVSENKKPSQPEQKVSGNGLSGNGLSVNGISGNTVSGDSFNVSMDEKHPELVEIDETIARNNYLPGSFRKVGDALEYYTNGRKTSTVGVDISKDQGDIDWGKVKNAGVEFAMIRMGVRGYSSGKVVVDENFKKNLEGAVSNGIKVGVYFYSQAVTKEEAVEEANYAVGAVSGYTLTYPIVFMTETIENDTARTDTLSKEALTECAQYFCQSVQNYGYKAMIAGNEKQLADKLDLSKLTTFDKWLLSPGEQSDYPYQYTMWQYKDNAVVDGIPGGAPLDISFVDYTYK